MSFFVLVFFFFWFVVVCARMSKSKCIGVGLLGLATQVALSYYFPDSAVERACRRSCRTRRLFPYRGGDSSRMKERKQKKKRKKDRTRDFPYFPYFPVSLLSL